MWWIHSIFLFSVNWTIWPKPFSVLLFQLVQQSKICDHHTSNLKKEYTGKTNIILNWKALNLPENNSRVSRKNRQPYRDNERFCDVHKPSHGYCHGISVQLRYEKHELKIQENRKKSHKEATKTVAYYLSRSFYSLSSYNPFELGLMPKKQLGAFSKQTLQFTRGPKPFPIIMNARGHCVLFWVLSGW